MGRKPDPKPYRHVVVRYQLPDGRRCKSTAEGARKVSTLTQTYYADLPPREPGGRPERVSLETDNETRAWKKLGELLDEREREAAGLAAPILRHSVRPIAEHLADFAQELRDGGNTSETQVKLLSGRLAELCRLAKWQRLPQIDRASALGALSRLTRERVRGMPGGYEGRSAQTRNHYLRHLKQFVTWCVRSERMERDTVALVEPVDVESARRHPRRSPSDGDVGTLMSYLGGAFVPAGKSEPLVPAVRCGMSGPARALGYRLCMATGYRAKELRTLTRTSFDLDAGKVRGQAAHTKNRKDVQTDLPSWLVAELRAHFEAGGQAWQRWPNRWPGKLLWLDQQACGVAHQTEEGFFDFHSLRVWFCTFAASQPGISPKTLQAMARHSDPRLTLKIYAKVQGAEVRKVVESMPRPGAADGPARAEPHTGSTS
jgi:integrase